MDRLREVAAKIIADYKELREVAAKIKEHYDFPWQGESHMEDCVMTNLQSLSQEAVRDEALEEAAKTADGHTEVGYLRDCCENIATAIRALKREPNAAAQARPEFDGVAPNSRPEPQMIGKDGWNYTGDPVAGEDARKIVTLHDSNGMAWVGIRAWHHDGKYWMNGSEPEISKVHAWRDLPDIARGQWSRGQLVMPGGTSDE